MFTAFLVHCRDGQCMCVNKKKKRLYACFLCCVHTDFYTCIYKEFYMFGLVEGVEGHQGIVYRTVQSAGVPEIGQWQQVGQHRVLR